MQDVIARDGFKLKSVAEDPASGTRRVDVERIGTDPKTGKQTRGVVKKTIYPKRMTPEQIDAAGEAAFRSAQRRDPGTKLDVPGTKLKSDGSPADGYFEATVQVGEPPVPLRIQGWYKQPPGGLPTISSHAPMIDKTWPVIDPSRY